MRRNQVIWACSEIGIDFQSPRERKLNPTHLYDSLNKAEKREPSLAEIFSPRAVAVVGVGDFGDGVVSGYYRDGAGSVFFVYAGASGIVYRVSGGSGAGAGDLSAVDG